MGRSPTPSFVVERRIYTEQYQYDFLQKKMSICNKIYNTAVKHYKEILIALYEDLWYQEAYKRFHNAKTDEKRDEWANEIFACLCAHKLTKYDIHKFMGKQKVSAFNKGIGINVVQKLGDALYASIKKAVFSQTDVHYRKRGQTNSFEDKRANSGIIFDPVKNTVTVFGKVMNLKPVRKSDVYMQEALTHRVKYCKIVRKTFNNTYHYFLQIVLEGYPPEKVKLGKGKCGIDEGVSTVAYYNNKETDFEVLADGVEKYERNIRKAAVKYERRLRVANPDNYNIDGTIKKGAKIWIRTNGCRKALMELKNAYRLKSEFIKQSHNRLVNRIVRHCDCIIKEPMNYRSLAKKAKETKRKDKATTITDKKGNTKTICKYKKKKRYGKSIGRRAPGMFNQKLCDKIIRLGGLVEDVNIQEYKASQYNHTTKTTIKPSLSDRTKTISNHKVQRDLYSSFLLYNRLDLEHIDFESCDKLFDDFLKKQDLTIKKVQIQGDTTKNFGLKEFNV